MKRLLILSGKGGTGKTTTTAAFIRFARARAVADCDVDAPNLHLVTPRRSEPVVSDFLGGKRRRWIRKNAWAAACAWSGAAFGPFSWRMGSAK